LAMSTSRLSATGLLLSMRRDIVPADAREGGL
jgi:hypothetical protein